MTSPNAAERGPSPASPELITPCAPRPADAQGGGRGREQHPERLVKRFELLSNEELAAFAHAHPAGAHAATEAHATLMQAFETRRPQREEVAADALRTGARMRELPAVFVCFSCGAHMLGFAQRRWDIERAMLRAALTEAELLEVLVVLAEAWLELDAPPPSLDAIPTDMLHRLVKAPQIEALRARKVLHG